jgi:hypothetical protein
MKTNENTDKGPGEHAGPDEIMDVITKDTCMQDMTPKFQTTVLNKLAEH